MRTFLVSALFVIGCASTDKPATRYAGEPFELAARPSRISGQVCGMDLDLDVARAGDGIALSGFLDGKIPVHLMAHALANGVAITGALGNAAGGSAVDLRIAADTLAGRVGYRKFDLRANGDTLAGVMQIPNAIDGADVVLEGRGQLAALPLDAQAALVPALLTCNVQPQGKWGKSALLVRVGGAAGALPHQSSSLYLHE